ncbi:hypothetical protein L208DRAFT_1310194, partial [Tricholoma matsutake]
FPPTPLDNGLAHKIVSGFCEDSSPSTIEEAGCALCGQLIPLSQLSRLKGVKILLHVLHASGVTRIERSNATQPIHEFKGPVLDYSCNHVCDNCQQHL